MGKKFTAPENLQDLEASDLEAAVNAAAERYKEIRPEDGADIDDETLGEIEAIGTFLEAADAENTTRVAAAEERATRLAAIDARINPPADEAEGAEGAEGAELDGAEAAGAEAEQFAKGKKMLPEDQADGGKDDAEEGPDGKKKKPFAVKAPANFSRGSLAARAAKSAPKQVEKPAETSRSKVRAAAGVPGFRGNEEFTTFADAAKAITARLNAMPAGRVADTYSRTSALVIEMPENKFTTEGFRGKDITELINEAAKEANLPGGSLVAAGGWGAPSERSLDFCDIESLDGLVSVPEITITRGGLEWTRGPHFGDVVDSSTGFWDMTEAVAEAGTELKTSIRPEVPTFEEARLDAVGVMMENGLLLRQGWPELVDRWAKLTLMAHQYKLSQKKLAGIKSLSGAKKLINGGFGNALDILHILEQLANGERQRLMLSPTATLEALIPWWVKSVIRIDLANRNGVDSITVTDAQIESHFTARGLKVQWIKALQDLTLDPTTQLALDYPDRVDVIFYPAGSFVAGVAPVLTLDTIYDSTNLKKNDYVHLFVEQGVLMTNPCFRGNYVSIGLPANGRRAAADITANYATTLAP